MAVGGEDVVVAGGVGPDGKALHEGEGGGDLGHLLAAGEAGEDGIEGDGVEAVGHLVEHLLGEVGEAGFAEGGDEGVEGVLLAEAGGQGGDREERRGEEGGGVVGDELEGGGGVEMAGFDALSEEGLDGGEVARAAGFGDQVVVRCGSEFFCGRARVRAWIGKEAERNRQKMGLEEEGFRVWKAEE